MEGREMDPYDFAAARLEIDVQARISAFWQAFAQVSDLLDAGFSGQAPGAIDQSIQVMGALQEVSPDLMWEFGPSDRGHTLCITAEWRDNLRPLARLVRQMAPDLPRWRFSDARGALDGDVKTAEHFEARFRQPVRLSKIDSSLGRDGRIDLVGHGAGSEREVFDQTLSMANLLLGEAVERDWIGAIESVPERPGLLGFLKKKQATFDAQGFRDSMRETIAQACDTMPDQPYANRPIDERPVSLLKIEGLAAAHRRCDLFVLNTSNQTHSHGMLSGGRFASPCHSRHGEWFLYLRISRRPETPFDQVDDRYALEAALHEALAADGTGGWVAGGTGGDAVYIDLAATHIGRAVERIAGVMAAEPSAAGATVHFLDVGLEDLVLPAVSPKPMVH
jgi:hypothetical protein